MPLPVIFTPVNNLRVLRYLTDELKIGEEDKKRWYAHWVQQGLARWNSCCARGSPGSFAWGMRPRWRIAA
ncbi:glutathione-S-transferase [Citrobacter koseri]|nr:glutathione-S-transferase [Citrobacter koseri]